MQTAGILSTAKDGASALLPFLSPFAKNSLDHPLGKKLIPSPFSSISKIESNITIQLFKKIKTKQTKCHMAHPNRISLWISRRPNLVTGGVFYMV